MSVGLLLQLASVMNRRVSSLSIDCVNMKLFSHNMECYYEGVGKRRPAELEEVILVVSKS